MNGVSAPPPARFGRIARHVGPPIAMLLSSAAVGHAQAHRNPAPPDSLRRIQSVEPRSGPPGTRVSIYTENLPLQARVVLGVGSIGTGFEELGTASQGEFGEVGATLTVPARATWDRALVFIIFDGNFAPTGLSDPFHVTNEDGFLHRTGTITDEGDGCIAMRDADGYFYTLVGPVEGLAPGDGVVVEGTFEPSGDCPQGETIRVVRRADPVSPES